MCWLLELEINIGLFSITNLIIRIICSPIASWDEAWISLSDRLLSIVCKLFFSRTTFRPKKVGAKDGDSAGTLAYNKGWKIIDDSYAFSNAIRLIVFLITGKLLKFYQNVFCFFKIRFWIGQYDQFHRIIDKFYFVLKFVHVCFQRCMHLLW